jgi:hypothetical protein
MKKSILIVILLCLANGCRGSQSDQGPVVEKRDSAVREAPMPLSVEVEGADREVRFGGPIPLSLTIRNSASRAIWVDENGLPWTYFGALKVQVDSPFLAASNPVADPNVLKWKKLEPGERLQGRVDLSDWLHAPARPPKTERVPVEVRMTTSVSESDPDQQHEWRTLGLDIGRLTIAVPPAGKNE